MKNFKSNQNERLVYQRMPEIIKNQLMDWIMDGSIEMGDKLNVEELAAKMGVSMMPVREALKSMEKSGIVQSIPYVGTRVSKLENGDVIQIYLIRSVLEPMAAFYACMNINEEGISKVESVHKQLENVIKKEKPSAKEIFVLNRRFHFGIYDNSNMNYLVDAISTLWDNLAFFKFIYGKKYVSDKASADKMLKEHYEYLLMLKQRDKDNLKESIKQSLQKRVRELRMEE